MCKNNKLLILITIYIVISISLIIKYNTFYTNVLNPLLSLCIIIYFRNIRFCKNRKYYIYIVVISCIHVIIYFYLGFIFGFSKSPYNHGIIDILKNIIIQILPIISVEMIRAFILNTNKNNKLIHILITILLILVEIKYNILIDLFQNKEEFFKYICSTILPLIASGILCTYLALKGSYSLSLVIRITNKLIVLILPILPNLDWFVTGTFNILSPVLIFLLFK